MTSASTLDLPSVTLCAVASVNVHVTIAAMQRCMDQIRFADAVLLTDMHFECPPENIRIVPINRLNSVEAYSSFVLEQLAIHIASDHCLIVQWDGFVIDPSSWDPAFLQYDFIGAPWPQFDDGRDVGNGGFSLRSRRLLVQCGNLPISRSTAEDVSICRDNRAFLESQGLHFAPREIAARFAYEREKPFGRTFGFHGVFNMVDIVGSDEFWAAYRKMDHRSTVYHDQAAIRRALHKSAEGRWHSAILWAHALPYRLTRFVKVLSR